MENIKTINGTSLLGSGDLTVSGLPTQTGQSGKFLTTDGTDASWSTSISNPLSVIDTSLTNKTMLTLGCGTSTNRYFTIKPDFGSIKASFGFGGGQTIILRSDSFAPAYSNGVSLGVSSTKWSNVYTTKLNNGNDITVPTVAGSMAVQVSSMPTADSTLEGQIYQYIGATDSTYTNGHFYKCVSDGQNPATYSWTEVSMGGGSSYTAGTGIDITGGVISVTSPTLQNNATGVSSTTIDGTATTGMWCVNIGDSSSAYGSQNVAVGASAGVGASGGVANQSNQGVAIGQYTKIYSKSDYSVAVGRMAEIKQNCGLSVAIGAGANCNAKNTTVVGTNAVSGSGAVGAIQIGQGTNNTAGTMAVGLTTDGTNWNNYELLSADGTIPTARLTKVNSTITLTAAGWSSNTQTVNVTGITATGVVMVSPDPTDQSAYTSAGILCTAQAAGTLTFTCDTVPSGDIDVNVVML